MIKAIVIGTSLSGKTTLVKYLRSTTNLPISEIDEELTKLNNGSYPVDTEYKNGVLVPKVVKDILSKEELIFFTNTNYFTVSDLKLAKKNGYKVIQLIVSLDELKKRNSQRRTKGYEDMDQWLSGMIEYQHKVKAAGLVDEEIDATQTTEEIAKKLILSEDKLNSDLNFIGSLSTLCIQENWRLVLYGGYGLDFVLGKITRPHRDIDAVIFGMNVRTVAIEKLTTFLTMRIEGLKLITKNGEFSVDLDIASLNFAANLYYVQTVNNPQIDLHTVRTQTGKEVINSEKKFPNPVMGKLHDFSIDVQDQNAHLADILVKKGQNKRFSKYEQDITHLRQITDASKVEVLVASALK